MKQIVALSLMLGLAACGKQVTAPPAAPPVVRFAPVGSTSATATVEAPGTVAWRRETTLGFTSAGRIARLTVEEGQAVRGGQLLAALDDTTVGAALSAAAAERTRAAAELQRSNALLAKGWVTRPRVDNAQAALAAADANVRAARFQANTSAIVAPGPGVVLARLAEPGQVVAAGAPVLVVGEAGGGRVLRVPLAEAAVQRVTQGAPASARLEDGRELTGQVIEVAGRGDRATGTFLVEIALPADDTLRSGAIGSARIVASGAAEQGLRVPAPAIFAARAGEAFVYVLDGQRVRVRRVRLGEAETDGVRVVGGLRPGELVAVSRIDRLKDGLVVTPQRLPR